MKPLVLTALAGYVVAAIHYILAFVNKRRSLERVAVSALAVGFLFHTLALIVGWAIDGQYPLLSLHETLSFLGWTLVATYWATSFHFQTTALASSTLPLVVLLTSSALLTPDGNSFHNVPGASTWLFPAHTTLLLFAYASFFVVFVASVMYLLQERELKLKTFSAIFHRLPSLTTINDIATSAAGIGLTLLTLGILTGMVWSSTRDGRVWRNDPKEIFAALTWLLYLLLILYRSSSGWRGRKAAWIGVLGFGLVICTFLGARLMGGYHVFG